MSPDPSPPPPPFTLLGAHHRLDCWSISHIPYQQVISSLKAFEDKAIGRAFSTTPLEGDAIYFDREVQDEVVLPLTITKSVDGIPSSSASSDRASEGGW